MKQCLILFCFSSFFFDADNVDFSYLDFNELILHTDIVLVATAVDQCNADDKESFVQFEIDRQIKGELENDLYINSEMLYQGDIPHSLKTVESFSVDSKYLLFLQRNAQSLTLLNQYTLKEIESNQEQVLVPLDVQMEDADMIKYAKSDLLQSIEAFVYNETEILDSEILVTE